jgi:hypothetical protein
VPATRHGLLDATVDQAKITEWWTANDFNVAIRTGPESGMFALDIDGLDGEAALRKLESQHGALPSSWETITPRGPGRHLGFAYPSDREVRNSASRIGPHLDVRGVGGFILCAPSIHPCGKRYEWSTDCGDEIVDAPPWLIELVATPGAGIPTPTPPEDWADLVAVGTAEGSRDVTIARITGHLLRRNVDPFVALELMRAWSQARCAPPLSDKDVERIVGSIAKAEVRRRSNGR